MLFRKILASKFFYQILPVVVCVALYMFFVYSSSLMIHYVINPFSSEKISLHLQWFDVFVGFFLYFVTAVDYALIIGRMSTKNQGLGARFVMNVGTCFGCFVGVTLVLFLWGFAKEVDWLIIALLVFAGSVMVKLAYESIEYYEDARSIWKPIRSVTVGLIHTLHEITKGLTFWIPELGSPKVGKLSLKHLATWSFMLPFIIGLDDFVGYMGAMTIYNVFSLLVGIYFADVLIDILIFLSPKFTKKMVENAVLSLLASYAFLYLTYKSFSEAFLLVDHTNDQKLKGIYLAGFLLLGAYLFGRWVHGKKFFRDKTSN